MTTTPRRTLARATAILAASLTLASATQAQGVPERLADSTFWRLMTDYSEPWGVFRSENFVSNETSLQWIIPELQRTVKPGGVYLGVAPDQNFTYMLAVKPSIAFIVDIRHQNAVEHLMYKALFEMSNSRAEFLAKLFARPALASVDENATAAALFDALANTKPDSALYRANLKAINDRLMKVHHFALSDSEVVSMSCVYGAFFTYGPGLSYNHSSDCRNPGPFAFGRGGRPGGGGGGSGMGGFGMPAYMGMIVETDSTGANHSYLATESNFRAMKNMEERNLIVPLTGNFAGEKALRAAGQYAREHGATVQTFYLSNVEQYLFQQDDEAQRFYKNVATLPIDSTSTFIRSFSGGMYGAYGLELKQQSGRSMQLVSSVRETLKAFDAGELTSWIEVVRRSRQ
ncbi:MAG: hypothetical protein ABIT20_02045 [Gemmatimonadaceae bacterium]